MVSLVRLWLRWACESQQRASWNPLCCQRFNSWQYWQKHLQLTRADHEWSALVSFGKSLNKRCFGIYSWKADRLKFQVSSSKCWKQVSWKSWYGWLLSTGEKVNEKCPKHQGEQDILRLGDRIVDQWFDGVSGAWFLRHLCAEVIKHDLTLEARFG